MVRKPLSKKLEELVLIECRRRCCICFGLNRDTNIKKGQIAHIDKNPGNHENDNLAFLCLDHHDQYDSKTSQSKNFTIREVKVFKKELIDVIKDTWKQPLKIGDMELKSDSRIDGHYIRDIKNQSAEFDIETLSSKKIKVSGIALWGESQERGPNIGTLDFESELKDNKLIFTDKRKDEIYQLELTFEDNSLIAREKNIIGYFGLNVSFEGEYTKVIT